MLTSGGRAEKERKLDEPVNRTSRVELKSIYPELNNLKKAFGRFELFNGAWIHEQLVTDPAAWINLVEAHLVGFNNPCEILEHFFGFIDKKMFDWYFSLDLKIFEKFADFKSEFLLETKRLAFQSSSLVFLDKAAFLLKFKELSGSEKLNKLADKYPLTTYFVEKCKIIRQVYPNSFPDDLELTVFVLSQIGTQTGFEQFVRFKSDYDSLLYFLKHQDTANSKSSN